MGIVAGTLDFLQDPVHEDLLFSLQLGVLRVGGFSWVAKLFPRAAYQRGLHLIPAVPVF